MKRRPPAPARGSARARARAASAVVAAALLAAGGCGDAGSGEGSTGAAPGATAAAPLVRFTDVTAAAGIDFVHESGARGRKLLPETMGGGCAFFDPDGDGDPDLFLANGAPWPEDASDGELAPTQRLYENDGGGRFADVTAEAGLAASFYATGPAVGDADGDGDPDLFLAAVGPNRLFANDSGRFRERTAEAGLAGDPAAWSTSAGFFDGDNDGDLDLFVCNYVRWSREIDLALDHRVAGIGRAYGPPTGFGGSHGSYLRNEGAGRFADASAEAGVEVSDPTTGAAVGKALGLAPVDVDLDGWIDVAVANDTARNFLFRNRGDGTFEEIGASRGLAYDRNGKATGAMGIDAERFRDDGSLGIAVGNFANEMTSLYVAREGSDRFGDEAIVEGIGAPSRVALSFGLFYFDADLDGRLDLLQANGHLEDEIALAQPSQRYEQPTQLFWNAGPGAPRRFVELAPTATGDLATPIVGRAAAFADVDGDGDLDVCLTQPGRRPVLLRNDQALGHRWLRVRLRQPGGNPEGIGARIELEAGGRTQHRRVMPTRSYLTQVEAAATFGLGDAEEVDRIVVRWPDGTEQQVEVEGLDREITVRREGAGTRRGGRGE